MLRRILDQLQDFFGISRKQARGAGVLIFVTFLIVWLPFLYRRVILPLVPVKTESYDIQKLDSLAQQLDAQPQPYPGNAEKSNYSHEKNEITEIHLTRFDPNTASVTALEKVGIPAFLTKRIDKYRSKGGRFRKKEDLLHIYDFPGELYRKLEPYIELSSGNMTSGRQFANNIYEKSSSKNNPKTASPRNERPIYVKSALIAFDINQADTTELVRLKGIGSKLSMRILKFRDGLGGFHSTAQYKEIYGLDSLAVSQLTQYAKILSPVRPIKINEISVDQLATHPYMRNRKLATVIINYRDQHGHYRNPEDLKKIRILDDNTLEKILPYLTF